MIIIKRLLCTGLVASTLLIGNITKVKANILPKIIANSKGQKAEVYTSADADERNDIKTYL